MYTINEIRIKSGNVQVQVLAIPTHTNVWVIVDTDGATSHRGTMNMVFGEFEHTFVDMMTPAMAVNHLLQEMEGKEVV